jgi:hypothetical protein
MTPDELLAAARTLPFWERRDLANRLAATLCVRTECVFEPEERVGVERIDTDALRLLLRIHGFTLVAVEADGSSIRVTATHSGPHDIEQLIEQDSPFHDLVLDAFIAQVGVGIKHSVVVAEPCPDADVGG